MLRRRREDDPDTTHRWLVSYADFITLLFAFFVVMYSISQINEGKYKVLSNSLLSAFAVQPEVNETPVETAGGGGANASGALENSGDSVLETSGADPETISLPRDAPPSEAERRQFAELSQQVQKSLQSLVDAGVVEVRANEDWIEIDMRSGLLFESGSDVLANAADPVIRELAGRLRDGSNLLRVRGYTDNEPIETERFPSNWELSSARAVAVVRMLQNLGVSPGRLAVEGYGQYNPVASNDTAQGRARNRRVVLAISRLHALKPDAGRTTTEQTPGNVADQTGAAQTGSVQSGSGAATTNADAPAAEPEAALDVVRLPSGGLLIRGKTTPPANDQTVRDKPADANADAAKNTPPATPPGREPERR